ncbi:helix-turn-helix domain-containing protein [Chitinophaga sp. sic0106]|uniref:helix-turn-helix domain-containing protein n=1 Tax=Chitinophaga sp. sic0106 TaxID=2854785 RepID=UPI001C484F6D|nr:AraC family transcriptional regulator [Chitinophaga sp. sic0106]MBV7529105.1 AraC family transcriptional regulator [Chitinophaga sp. sic0106]
MPEAPKSASLSWKVRDLDNIAETQSLPAKTGKPDAHTRLAPRITETEQRYERVSYEMLEKGCMLVSVHIQAKQDTHYHLAPNSNSDFYYLAYANYTGDVERKPLVPNAGGEVLGGKEICSFYNNQYGYETTMKAGAVIDSRIFAFTREWLEKRVNLAVIPEEHALMCIINKTSDRIAIRSHHFNTDPLRELNALLEETPRSPLFPLLLRKFAYSLISNIFSLLSQPAEALLGSNGSHEMSVNRIIHYLEQHYRAGFPGIPFLAALAGMSEATMRRHFLHLTGNTTHEYFTKVQMNFAYESLQQQVSVKEVALTLGFRNPANFTRLFKANFGITPSAFRQKIFPATAEHK